MKGFTTILVAASVFVVAILLLSIGPAKDISYNSNFSEMKIRISNYEVLMSQMAQECDWTEEASVIDTCLNDHKQNLTGILIIPYTNCTTTDFISDTDTNTAILTLECTTTIDSQSEGYFSNHLIKEIVVKKYAS